MYTQFYFEGLFEAIADALFNTLWQGMIVGVVLLLSTLLKQKQNPNIRYWLAYLAIVAIFLVFVVNLSGNISNLLHLPYTHQVSTSSSLAELTKETKSYSSHLPSFQAGELFFTEHSKLISLFWLLGVVVFILNLFYGLIQCDRIRKNYLIETGAPWQLKLAALQSSIGLKKVVLLKMSNHVKAPATFGWIRPIVLVPCTFFTSLSEEQIELIILHELAHIKRHDYLLNVIKMFIQSLLFFHPVVWWAAKIVDEEREFAADSLVLNIRNDSLTYIKTLVSVAGNNWQNTSPAISLLDNKKTFSKRINRILQQSNLFVMTNRSFINVKLSILVCLSLLAITGLALGFQRNIVSEMNKNSSISTVAIPQDTTKKGFLKVGTGNVEFIHGGSELADDTIRVEAFPVETELQAMLQFAGEKDAEYFLDENKIDRLRFAKLRAITIDTILIWKGDSSINIERIFLLSKKALVASPSKDQAVTSKEQKVTILLENFSKK